MLPQTENNPLQNLDDKIRAAKSSSSEDLKTDDHHSSLQNGWRMVIELVVGLAIGLGVGYGLDALLGTSPLFLIVFVLLGFAAGVRTMLTTAKEIQNNSL